MKKSINTLIMLFSVLLVLAACKKQVDNLEPVSDKTGEIGSDELLNYYIVLRHQNDYPNLPQNLLQVFDFTKYGWDTEVTTRLFNVTSQSKQKIVFNNNKLVYDIAGDGKDVYSFQLAKDSEGKITLSTYQYVSKGDMIAIFYAQIFKKTEAPIFKGKIFRLWNNTIYFLKFTPNNTWYSSFYEDFRDADVRVYHQDSPVIWAGSVNPRDKFLGVCVPYWKDINQPLMLVDADPGGFQMYSVFK
ncbi:hypothetical protein ABIE26_002715 [Pedobacter africanus]|uniref:Uncharacterized protein n=1 Tax=Pedobacter africanus TaxID=151894 RepID=A0ACC6KXE3_9SPHI|nr:hypothetical protein [Pedobacter africanus]MDR6783896.1 hypothetical protein [Pedobacter africanus]